MRRRRRPTRRRGPSRLELEMALHIRALKLPVPEREFRFHPKRQFRFDFAWPERKIALEVEGLVRPGEKSRHTTNSGYTRDCTKYNMAVLLGWRVLRVTGKHITDGSAARWLEEILE